MVSAFHKAMGIPIADEPTMLTADRAELRCRLIDEEAHEFREAAEYGDWIEMVDALVDILYVTYGAAVEMGVDLAPFFEEVHNANMRKLPGDGGGKSRKPQGWFAPDLARVHRDVYGDTPLPVHVPSESGGARVSG
jgi:predicted HAD superfamily Cof-like phosphohydrolase